MTTLDSKCLKIKNADTYEKAILSSIVSHLLESGDAPPSIDQIVRLSGTCERTVARKIDSLEAKKYLKRVESFHPITGEQQAIRYYVNELLIRQEALEFDERDGIVSSKPVDVGGDLIENPFSSDAN